MLYLNHSQVFHWFDPMHKEKFPINSKIQEITSKAISYLWKPHQNTKLQLFILFSVIKIYKQQGKKQIKQLIT